MTKLLPLVVAATLVATLTSARAEIIEYYVGVDTRAIWPSGIYASQPNPNHNRLTFLYAHGFAQTPFNNHYHTIGSYFFVGPSNAPVVVSTNANFRIPEPFTGQPPLTLSAATNGLFAGKLVNLKTSEHYSDSRIRSVNRLLEHRTATSTNTFGWGSGEYIMYHSTGGRFAKPLDGVVVAMELVRKSTELRIGTPSQLEALTNPGDRVTMGDGPNFEFTPVVWVEPNTAPGTYELKFKLVDVGGGPSPALDSGIVTFWYQVVGEPQLTIARTVTLKMPLVTDGYVLEEAPSVDGPWTPVATPPTPEVVGAGEGATQTGFQILTQSSDTGTKVYRLRKL